MKIYFIITRLLRLKIRVAIKAIRAYQIMYVHIVLDLLIFFYIMFPLVISFHVHKSGRGLMAPLTLNFKS